MTGAEIRALEKEYVLPTYARFDVCLVQGKGCRARDAEGREYLDFTSGIGVNSLGWADGEWAAAVAGQAAALQHTSNLFYTEPMARLARALCEKAGMRKVFYANSGAEANEGAIKAARKYSHDKYPDNPSRHTILTLTNSFHGRTMATLTATGQEGFHRHFAPFVPGFAYVQAGDAALLEQALSADVCAVLFEPIQGEGGVVPLDIAYLQTLQALCRQRDILLLADEVQTGVGRTGAFLACQQYGVAPDIVTLAKGLGGGLPLGAVLFGEKTAQVLAAGDHGSTFGGNPVACAGALVVVNRLDDAFLAGVAAHGRRLKEGLAALPGVASVHGDGLMLGVAFRQGIAAADVLHKAMERGLLCLLAKTKLRLLPPLVVTAQELDEGVAIIKHVLEEITA